MPASNPPRAALPDRPDLGQQRRRARELLRALRRGETEALARARRAAARFEQLSDAEVANLPFKLADAQLILAREYGFPSWPRLKRCIEHGRARLDDPAARHLDDAIQAVIHGRTAWLRQLLADHPALVHARSAADNDATLLHFVAANGVRDELQRTPDNIVEIAELLLAAGAEVNALSRAYGGGAAQTPLALLVSSGHPHEAGRQADLVRCLARHGAALDGLDGDGLPLANALTFWYPDAVRTLARCGARPTNLIFAAAAGRLDLVRRWIGRPGQASPDAPHCPIRWLEMSRDPAAQLTQALAFAAMCDQFEVVEALLAHAAHLARGARRGQTALHLAAYRGSPGMVERLLAAGADPDLADAQFHAKPVSWANAGGRPAIVELLLPRTAPDIEVAVDLDRPAILADALDGRDPNTPFPPGGPGCLLRTAAAAGKPEVVRWLLAHGADRSLADPDGRTALDLARAAGRTEIVALLA